MPSQADDYKNVPADELRQLCAFKDGTIEILQNALRHTQAELKTLTDGKIVVK